MNTTKYLRSALNHCSGAGLGAAISTGALIQCSFRGFYGRVSTLRFIAAVRTRAGSRPVHKNVTQAMPLL